MESRTHLKCACKHPPPQVLKQHNSIYKSSHTSHTAQTSVQWLNHLTLKEQNHAKSSKFLKNTTQQLKTNQKKTPQTNHKTPKKKNQTQTVI